MENIMLCRLCLNVEGRKYSLVNTPLQDLFEKIANAPLCTTERKPVSVCHICLVQLKKSHMLMMRAQKADQILNQLIQSGVSLTQRPCIDLSSYNLFYKYTITQIECIDIHGENTVKEERGNVEEPLKEEVATERLSETVEEMEKDYGDLTPENHQTSDSEDDVPLKNIRVKKSKEEKKKVRVKKKECTQKRGDKGFTADFAKEIILTKEEQLQELLVRSKSLNYLNSPLKCELCYKGFIDTRAYENHKGKHDERSGPHECAVCRMRYPTERQLRTHAVTSHGRRYQCARCPHRAHTANQAREHEKWHRGHTYECKLCGHKFRKPTSYLTHMRKRHPSSAVCGACGDSFVGPHGLRMHVSKAHARAGAGTVSTPPSEPASERFCGECSIQFATKEAWKRHVLTSVNHSLTSDHSLQCKICELRFPSAPALSAHLRAHARALSAGRAPPPPAPPRAASCAACDQCGSRFINRAKLQAHVKRIHLGLKYNKNIVCEVCGKKCTSNASLMYHQRTHTGEKPYQCDACNKRFADSNQLRIHTRTHTGERPYSCGVCGKRFSQKPALNRHYRVHTGVKPYTCTYCAKTFSQSNSLKLHISTVHLKIPPNRRNKQTSTEIADDSVTLQTL